MKHSDLKNIFGAQTFLTIEFKIVLFQKSAYKIFHLNT